jgi:hypothetical protein
MENTSMPHLREEELDPETHRLRKILLYSNWLTPSKLYSPTVAD